MRNLLLLIVVLGTLSFTLSKEVSRNVEIANISPGKIAPVISLKNQSNELVSIEDFKGKFIYINLWTTWSEPSKAELPHLQGLVDSYSESVVFINLSIDYQRDKDKWKTLIKDQNLKGIQLIATQDWQSDFVSTYNVVKIPRAILIDQEGKIIDAYAPKPSQKSAVTKLFDTLIK